MVNQHWLLNCEAVSQEHGQARGGDVSLQSEPDSASNESELEIALSKLRTQIDVVNELLKKDKSKLSPLIDITPNRYFDINWERLSTEEYGFRRKRDDIFSGLKIFSEPAWDILLDLMIAENKGIRLPTSSVALGSGVPATTTLRWLSLLEEKGLIYREDDLLDGRRSFVRLSDLAIVLMKEALGQRYRISSNRTIAFHEI